MDMCIVALVSQSPPSDGSCSDWLEVVFRCKRSYHFWLWILLH
jgi:hypothetical protein